jgi:hypothetical protein
MLALASAPTATAGSYPMYQCTSGAAAVSSGWSTFAHNTNATTTLHNACSSGGTIGVYAFTNGQAGAVTESGSSGSQVGLALNVPASAPNVIISSIRADVTASSVSGDDAFLGFSSEGQALTGLAELSYGGAGDYEASESWILPQGARDFEAYVNCSTDRSSPTCYFSDPFSLPALSEVTINLIDAFGASVSSVSGALASAVAGGATVSGSESFGFTARDADSGVRSATLTLTPKGAGPAFIHSFDFSMQCRYDAWNACPPSQSVGGFAVDTSALRDDTYSVDLAIADAAGNIAHDDLGTITSHNAQADPLGALPGPDTAIRAGHSGVANGNGATEAAHLEIINKSVISRSFARRALQLSGRLLDGQGRAIGGATLDILQQVAGTSAWQTISQSTSQADGSFQARVPGGASRVIEIAYRAFAGDDRYAAHVSIQERVNAGVQLSISPRRSGSNGSIILSGAVQGPIPAQGAIVELLVHYRGRWEPFRTPRTDAAGRFRVAYRFQGGVGRFPFRAEVPGGQAGFPYSSGSSRSVAVTTG